VAFLLQEDGTRYALTPLPLRVGRNVDNEIRLEDESVSGHHARLERRGGVIVVIDLGSSNGTYVNKQPISDARPLAAGDVIQFARVKFRFQVEAAEATCAYCGRPLRAGARFCAGCGQPTTVARQQATEAIGNVPGGAGAPTQRVDDAAPLSAGEQQEVTERIISLSEPPTLWAGETPPGGAAVTQQVPYRPAGYGPSPLLPGKPAAAAVRIDFSLALGFVFQEPGWLAKLLVGGMILALPVVGWVLVSGYLLEVARRVIAADSTMKLPAWHAWGRLLQGGSVIFLLTCVWSLLLALPTLVPGYLIAAALDSYAGLSFLVVGALLYLVALNLVWPVVWGRYALTRDVAAGLQVGAITGAIGRNARRYLLNALQTALFLFGGALFIAAVGVVSATTITLGVGVCGLLLTMMLAFYLTLFEAHLLAQLYRTVA
jgi:hypothetical protein